jgi:channel protein (hemolysin III family)
MGALPVHLCRYNPTKEILRRLDHAAIFIMIAATYTPFAANRLSTTPDPLFSPLSGYPRLWA